MSTEDENQQSVPESTEDSGPASQENEAENSAQECEGDQTEIENSGEGAEAVDGEENQVENGDGDAEEAKGELTEDQTSEYDQGRRIVDDKDGPNKIFVGGITPETSEDDLRAYFSQHGNILDITIMRDRFTGKSRGFGFITFDTVEVAEKLVMSKHEVNGKMVEAKPAVPRGSQSNTGGRPGTAPYVADGQRSTKLFVGGLSPSVNDAELKEYFAQFGEVEESIVVVDKDTNRKRGFGFVTFTSYQSVDNVLAKKEHTVVDKVVEVKRALPKGSGPSGPMGRGGGPPMMSGRPGSYPPPRGYGPGPGGPAGQGYYPPAPGGYGQQGPGYGYYGGYDQRGGYSGYGGGYGGPGYSGYGAGYGGYDQSGYGAQGYDYSQQGQAPTTYGYDASGQYAAQAQTQPGYDSQAYNGYYAGYNAATPAATTAAPTAYGYGDTNAYGATTTAATNRYHPYART